MKLANWFKIAWWVFVLAVVTAVLATRLRDFIAGKTVVIDVPIFIVWTALLVLPFFQEVTLFGMTFKKELAEMKADVKDEISGLRSDIRSAVDVRTQVNPNFFFPTAPPDSQLPNIEKRIQAVVEDALKARGEGAHPPKRVNGSQRRGDAVPCAVQHRTRTAPHMDSQYGRAASWASLHADPAHGPLAGRVGDHR
jgi:hypothetical protein